MAKCRRIREVEQWFDGELEGTGELERHVDGCPECAAHLEELRRFRTGVAATGAPEAIRDAQFPAFMEGIRERVEYRPFWRGRLWALASVTAAALIVAVSAFLVLTDGSPERVEATVVESCSTDLEGATVTSYASETGVTTVWVRTMSQEDVW